jgi:hypothetical protein
MKKIYSLFSLALLACFAFSSNAGAQITVTSADMPSIGTKIVNGYDTATSSVSKLSIPTMGASISWDYHFLPTSYMDTTSFVNPSSTP